MTVGVIACTIEAMDIVRGKKDPPLHYFTGGIIGGFLAGGMVSLVDKHCSHTPFRFRPVFAVKSSVVFGLAGLGMGLAANFMEKRTYMYEKNRSKTGGAGTSGNPIYDMLFPPKEEK